MSASRLWSRSATRSMSISAIASTTSRPTAAPARSCSTSRAVSDARKFMSAARAAARAKPVVVIKSGRHAQGARAAATHTGALAGSDAVYDAAFRRAGLLRVFDLDELFAAAETLGRQKPFPGKRLAILTNGGGVGVLAVDRLIDLGGTLAALSPRHGREARSRAAADLVAREPGRHHRRRRCRAATPPRSRRCSPTRENDAVLVLNVPTALASASAGGAGRRRDRARATAQKGFAPQARLRGLARRGRRFEARLRERRHPAFRHRGRRGARLHASRALPRGAGPPDGDAGQPAAGFRARHGDGARASSPARCGEGRALARPARGQPRCCAPTTSRSRP